MIALAQHCSRLKKLNFSNCQITATSLIALSERGLPLEEFSIPSIPIPSAEIAAQCAHALSRIRELSTYDIVANWNVIIQYMTGLRGLHLNNSKDHLLVPHMVPVHGHCTGLEVLLIGTFSSIAPQQLCELAARCPHLHTLSNVSKCSVSNTVLVELAHSCPHLQKITLYSISEVTEEGVLTLAVHCRQLRVLVLSYITVTEETVRQLAQHCRHLTKLQVSVYERQGEAMAQCYKDYSSKEIRALRETERAVALRL